MSAPDFTNLTNLAASKLGGRPLSCSDDFFAEMENLTQPGRGVFIEDKYTDRGKWMDGWESRRKRDEGNDWCIIKLATQGVIEGVDIDTNHFLGNHPPHASIEAVNVKGELPESVDWTEIVAKSPLDPGDHNYFEVGDKGSWTHLRLNIFPDGGVARLKVYGRVSRDLSEYEGDLDLAAAINGGRAILCNDMFFSHMNNLIMPEPGENMGDGWETKRNRTPGNVDWVIIQLAARGMISRIVLDNKHFKGNYPHRFSIDGCRLDEGETFEEDKAEWVELIRQAPLSADAEHEYEEEIVNQGPFTHVRLNIYPDGGVSRLRLFGSLSDL